jgi:hypothetical protein
VQFVAPNNGEGNGLARHLNHSSMVNASLGINILAMLPLASNASSAVSARLCRQLWQGLQPNIFASLCERRVEVHGFGERAFRAFKGSLILPVLI